MKKRHGRGDPGGIPFYFKCISVCVAIILWQLAASLINSTVILSGPVRVLTRLCGLILQADFWNSVGFTFWHIAAGFLCGTVLACLLAFAAERFRAVEYLVWPYMVSVKSIPVASIVVICLVWFSAGNLSVFISFLIVLPIVYNNVLAGLKNRSRELDDVSEVFGVTGFEKVKTVLLPQAAPYLLSACETAAGVAWKAGVAAEVIGTPAGSVGRQLYLAKIYLDTDDLFAWTLVIVLISALSEKLFMKLLNGLLHKFCGL